MKTYCNFEHYLDDEDKKIANLPKKFVFHDSKLISMPMNNDELFAVRFSCIQFIDFQYNISQIELHI